MFWRIENLFHLILYGRNNSLSNNLLTNDPNTTISWQFLKDAGVTIFRENGGNNSTKYNWRRKNYRAIQIGIIMFMPMIGILLLVVCSKYIPSAQAIWAFQLIGKAAKPMSIISKDWDYNRSQWWEGVNQNLAGGGAPNTSGGAKALREGTPSLYLEDWTADSTTGILDYWFNKSRVEYRLYQSPLLEIWIMNLKSGVAHTMTLCPPKRPLKISCNVIFAVAKRHALNSPKSKLMGPVPANEWQWYNYNNDAVTDNGVNIHGSNFFIKRIAKNNNARAFVYWMSLISLLPWHE